MSLLSLAIGLSMPSIGQEIVLNPVIVTGQAASARKALIAQERADYIVSVISADDIGALPDKNAAEALARAPGVSLQRDQGEGRYVSIRGVGPDLNSVTINGSLVPSPEAGRRGVALDTLPAGMIRSLEVSKTLTPDRDANSIGGTIDVKTLSAFDLPGSLLTFGLGASQDQLTSQTSPNASVLWARRFSDGKVGVAIGASKEQRRFGSDNVETGGAWSDGRLAGAELRDYLPNRERGALSVNIDYKPAATESYYFRGFSSSFSDDEVRDRLTFGSVASTSGGSFTEGQTATARAERRLRARKYTQEIDSFALGTVRQWDAWKLEAAVASGAASESTPESINDARFRQNNVTGVSFSNTKIPIFTAPAAAYDPARYALREVVLQASESKDTDRNLKLDATYKFDMGQMPAELKFGSKFSRREKTNDTDAWLFSSSSIGASTMAPYTHGELQYTLGRIGLGINPALVRSAVASLARDSAKEVRDSAIEDFTLNEDIDSVYLQNSFDVTPAWNVLVGVRNEATRFRAAGFQVGADDTIQGLVKEKSYNNLLPGVHTRYQLDKQTSVRAAWSNSVVRPNFEQISPGINFEDAEVATIGNPDLLPLKSANFDLGIERMLGQHGAMSAYVFSKNIKDFTYTTNLAGTGVWAGYESATSYANGSNARVSGLELSYTQALRMLPGIWSGLLVGANATFTNSAATLSRFDKATNGTRSRDIPLPGQSDNVFNVWVGYERGPISARLAVNRKSPYLLEVGEDILDPVSDVYVDTQQQLDFSMSYQAHKNVQITFEAINLNDEKYYVYYGSQQFNNQYERYGRTVRLGLKFSMF